MVKDVLEKVKQVSPLVHNITNYVTINDCANITLACGASPIMAEAIEEVEDIVALADGVNLNMGMLTKEKLASMLRAGRRANALHKPVVLDPVGAGASLFRKQAVQQLLRDVQFAVIRGNLSEMRAIGMGIAEERGVDSSRIVEGRNLAESVALAKRLSNRTGAVIIISGAMDIVADKDKAYVVHNGSAMMGRVSGTGCMLSSVLAAYVSVNKESLTKAALAAVCAMGLCGEIAENRMGREDGNAAFRTYLIDAMYHMNGELLEKGARYELYEGNDACVCGK